MKKILLVIALSFALVALAGALFAQGAATSAAATVAPPAPPAPPQLPSRIETLRPVPCILPTLRLISPLSGRLNLTEDQRTKVTELLTKADADLKPKIENQIKVAADYVKVLVNTDATQAELVAAANNSMKAETDVLMARIQTLFAMRALLTPDQNKQLSEYLAQATIPWSDRAHVLGGRPQTTVPTPPPAAK